MKTLFLILVTSLLASCASTPPAAKTSYAPEVIQVTFRNTSTEAVLVKLGKKCNQIGAVVKDQQPDYILCSRRLSDTDAVLINIPAETVIATKPENKMKFIASKSGNDVSVVAQQWAETRSKSGELNRVDMMHARQKANMLKILMSMGAV